MKQPHSFLCSSVRRLASLVALPLLLAGLTTDALGAVTPTPKGNRLLGIDVNTTQSGDYAVAFSVAKNAGMQVTSLVVNWDELEIAPGVYAPNPNWLWIANAYYPWQNTQVLLTIVPIDTVRNRLPADLVGHDLDDPEVVARFKALLTWVFSEIPQLHLTALAIGNETDIYLGNDPERWAHYRNFFAQAAAHARALRPGLQVGVQTTFDSMVGTARAEVAALHDLCDVIMVSYYPLNANLTVKSPSVVSSDWALILNAYPQKPVMFAQIGYPSSALNNSGLTKQKLFIDNVFAAWDTYASRVSLLMFVRLHDAPDHVVDAWGDYYGMADAKFDSFLATLGMRTSLGADKSAFTAFKRQAKARGW